MSSFVCAHWLERTIPRLESKPLREVHAIVISYLSKNCAGRGRFWQTKFLSSILEASAADCTQEEDYVVWHRGCKEQETVNANIA